MRELLKFFLAGLLTSSLATADQVFVVQKSACLAALSTILLICLSTYIVVDISSTKRKINIIFYAAGCAVGTFLTVKFL